MYKAGFWGLCSCCVAHTQGAGGKFEKKKKKFARNRHFPQLLSSVVRSPHIFPLTSPQMAKQGVQFVKVAEDTLCDEHGQFSTEDSLALYSPPKEIVPK